MGGSSFSHDSVLTTQKKIGNGRVAFYASTWLVLVIGLSFINKGVFKWTGFKYPVLLSTVHMVVNWILSVLVWKRIGNHSEEEKSKSSGRLIMYFSLLFVLNIAFGNMSVKAVNLLLSQVFRSSMPIFIMISSIILKVGNRPSLNVILTVLPIIVGVYLTCQQGSNAQTEKKSDQEDVINLTSLLILLTGNIMCALKTTLTNKYLNQYQLHPIYLLSKLSMWSSFGMFALACVIGEVSDLYNNNWSILYNLKTIAFVLTSAFVAFLLNLFNFLANSSTSPLTMGILGLLHQIMTVYLSTIVFDTPLTSTNIIGICLAMIGSALYTFVKYKEQFKQKSQ